MVLSHPPMPEKPKDLPVSQPPSLGEFHDRFVKRGGKWLFQSRTLHRFFRGFAPV